MAYEMLETEITAAAEALTGLLREKKMTFATAESCTAGMIASRLGDIAGVSDVFVGGIVSYANEVKKNVLGVPRDVLASFGAVSEPCAEAMAKGARRLCGSSLAVSVTGIAGPAGGTKEKPVGTVCFAVSDERGTATETVRFDENADRGTIRRLTVLHALELACSRLK